MKTVLVKDIENRLLQVFVEKGFMIVPLPTEEVCSELSDVFPLGRLKRERDGKLEIVEIQFDKYGRPRFAINFGVVPSNGVDLPWGDHLDRDKAGVSALYDAYRLHSSPFFCRWFQLGLLTRKNEKAIRRLVDRAIVLSAEIDQWLMYRSIGKHMRKFGLRRD